MRGSRGVAHLANVVLRVRRVADQRQFQIAWQRFERLAHFERMILRLHAADVEEIAAGLES